MAPTAIITGAARGIGRAIAIRLVRDGYRVTANDLPSAKSELESLISSLPPKSAIAHTGDITSRASVQSLIDASVESHGPLNTMIANAGIVQVKPLIDCSESDIERMFDINVYGLHNCYAAAAKQFIAQGKIAPLPQDKGEAGLPQRSAGVYKIIGASSIAGYRPFPQLGHYSASKFAVRGLTQAWAMEVAKHGITVNAYAPGIVGTKMWEEIDEGIGMTKGAAKGATMKRFVEDMVLMGRTSVPDDVANFVSFLAGPDSDYITGQNLICDGGIQFT